MILGIGTDILEIERMQFLMQRFGDKVLRRLFTQQERKMAEGLSYDQQVRFYAKRFSGKEAASKALGTGIGGYLSWQDISILNTPAGKPVLNFSEKVYQTLLAQYPCVHAHISLSDDKQALAFVVVEALIR